MLEPAPSNFPYWPSNTAQHGLVACIAFRKNSSNEVAGPLPGFGVSQWCMCADMNTDGRVMSWFFDEYSKFEGFSPGVVTGKARSLPPVN